MTLAVIAATMILPATSYASPTLDTEEVAFCKIINDYRVANGLPALLVSTDLSEASDWHTDDMAAKNYFSHTDSLGRDPFVRMSVFGYNFNTWKGENIAAGNSTASGTFTQWKNSSGHNANMLNANFKVMGIARSYNAASTYKYYWNNNFGGVVDGAVPCSGAPAPAPTPTPTPTPVPTLPTLSVNDVSVVEGTVLASTAKFTIRLSKASLAPASVFYWTVNTTALKGLDYSARLGTAVIPAGQVAVTVNVPIIRDNVKELDETFKFNLSTPVGATISDYQAIGTIRNDD
jgi:cysteine-rich secretory family protein/Calx-beta domain-containing protein